MRNLSTDVFQSKAEVVTTSSELNKILQPTHFIPQHKKAGKVQVLTQLWLKGTEIRTSGMLCISSLGT